MRGMISKLVTCWPKRARAIFSSASARSGVGEADEGGRARARPREQLQRRSGDDPERALGADEQVLEVVAGVVLAQLGEEIGDAPVGEHDLDAERQVARVAIGDDRDAAGVGGEIAADGGGSFRGERQREQPVDRLGRRLRLGERHARFDDHRVGVDVDLADAVEPLQRQQQFAAAGVGNLAADQAGVAALRHDRHVRRRAGRDDRRDFRRRAWAHDRDRAAAEQPARLFEIGGDEIGVDDDVGGADDLRQPIEKGGSVVHPSGPLRRLTGRRRKAARSSTWGEKRNWSSAATGPIS